MVPGQPEDMGQHGGCQMTPVCIAYLLSPANPASPTSPLHRGHHAVPDTVGPMTLYIPPTYLYECAAFLILLLAAVFIVEVIVLWRKK